MQHADAWMCLPSSSGACSKPLTNHSAYSPTWYGSSPGTWTSKEVGGEKGAGEMEGINTTGVGEGCREGIVDSLRGASYRRSCHYNHIAPHTAHARVQDGTEGQDSVLFVVTCRHLLPANAFKCLEKLNMRKIESSLQCCGPTVAPVPG